MSDIVSKEERSRIMSLIRGQGNERTEQTLIRLFRGIGITGWRRHQSIKFETKGLRKESASDGTVFKPVVRPDFSFPKSKVAVFVDGCFWHGCPKCYRRPKSRKVFWSAKILRNRERDAFQTRQLKRKGWHVIRLWEHQLQSKSILKLAERLSVLKQKPVKR